jgi:hypothetical protein
MNGARQIGRNGEMTMRLSLTQWSLSFQTPPAALVPTITREKFKVCAFAQHTTAILRVFASYAPAAK